MDQEGTRGSSQSATGRPQESSGQLPAGEVMAAKIETRREAEVRILTSHTHWWNEPALVLTGYLVLTLLIRFFAGSPVRAWLAGGLALLGSGFSLVTALYPRRDTLDWAERLALSALFSLAIGGAAGYLLIHLPVGMTLVSFLVATALFNVICYVVVIWRRWSLAPFEQPAILRIPAGSVAGWFHDQGLPGILLTVVLLALMLAGGGALYQSTRTPALDPPMTEFFLLDANGQVEDLPDTAAPGQAILVGYSVSNHEHGSGPYQVLALVDGRLTGDSGAFRLADGQAYRSQILVSIPQTAIGNTRIDFILFRDGKRYRSLDLWLQVANPGK